MEDYDEIESLYDENLSSITTRQQQVSEKSSTTVRTKRYRGEAKGLKEKKGPKNLEWDRLSRPIGDWKTLYVNSVGKKVHANLNINIRYWKNVPTSMKEKLWEELRRKFNIEDTKKKVVLKSLQKTFKDWKAKLVSGYITFTRKMPENPKPPYELYAAITKDQWEQFVADRTSNEFKEISVKARVSQAHNKHPHYMGAKSYAQKENDWRSEGRYPLVTDESENSTHISKNDRSWCWILGRQRKNEKGHWEFPIEETQRVVEKIEKVMEEVNEGKFTPNRQDDVLSRGLGRIDHRGRVLGIGGTIGHRDYFGRPEHRHSGTGSIYSTFESFPLNMEQQLEDRVYEKLEHKWRAQVRAQTIAEMKEVMEVHVQQQVKEILKNLNVKLPSELEIKMGSDAKDDLSSCLAVDPFAQLEGPTPCHLTMIFNYNKESDVVAIGMVMPSSSTVTHCMPNNIDHVRVSVDKTMPKYKITPLPVPSPEFSLLGEAEGSFVQWPKSLVKIQKMGTDVENILIKNSCNINNNIEKKVDESHKTLKLASPVASLVCENDSQGLSNVCCNLKKSFIKGTLRKIQLHKDVFGYEHSTYISTDDVTDLLSDDWLNVSVLSSWIMYLNNRCVEKNVKTIAFLCPENISSTKISANLENMHSMEDYVKDVMLASQNDKKFILGPYFQDKHWILLAIAPTLSRVYVFDPMRQPRKLTIRHPLIRSFNLYKIRGGSNSGSNLNWSAMTCAQQPGGKECGYYVMRYMLDMVDKYNSCINLFKEYQRTKPYNKEEILEVKDLWASYILDNMM